MSYNILLGKSRNKNSVNEHNYIGLNLNRDTRLLPVEDIVSNVNEYEQYVREKDACDKYRFIFTVNTYASNVLFNAVTEVVYKEGSNNCTFLGLNGGTFADSPNGIENYCDYKGIAKNNINRQELLRDTSYSHKDIGPLVYHCGYDIFSNHILRSTSFTLTCKISENETDSTVKKGFNSINDVDRTHNGEVIKENIFNERDYNKVINRHQYQYDTISSFKESFSKNLIEKDGWFGFKNVTRLNIPNYGDISLNKVMNNNKPFEQIDMYPDRSLFSFVPKYNKYRNRPEYNWKYCLTYPYRNITDHELVKGGMECETVTQANEIFSNDVSEQVLPMYEDEKGQTITKFITGDGETITQDASNIIGLPNTTIIFRTLVKHNLKEDDYIKLTFINDEGEFEINEPLKIERVGYNNDGFNYYFVVKGEILMDELKKYIDGFVFGDDLRFRYKRLYRGKECGYYIRTFKRVPNFNNTEVFQDGKITEEEIAKYTNRDFSSSLNNLAFSKTIYNDNVAQIIFNEDVTLKGLKDNLGRPVSELFLTIVKNNQGYKKWYGKTPVYNTEDIEYSHCFGKVTAGLDMPEYCEDYNVHRIHNISNDAIDKLSSDNMKFSDVDIDVSSLMGLYYTPKTLGGEITINGDETLGDGEFYGDIVEFEPYTLSEIVLDDVMFRFNTAQREYTNFTCGSKNGNETGKVSGEYANITYDSIISDDYELTSINSDNVEPFKVDTENYNVITIPTKTNGLLKFNYPGNIFPEGYFYKPHFRILLKEYSEVVNQGNDTKIGYSRISLENTNGTNFVYNMRTIVNYYLNVGDTIVLYDTSNGNRKAYGVVTEVGGRNFQEIKFTTKEDILEYEYFEYHTDSNVYFSLKEVPFGVDYEKVAKRSKTIPSSDVYSLVTNWYMFKINPSKPDNAYNLDDGTGRYLWRDFKSESAITQNDETYDMVFTNGKKYIYDNLNLYLRRQDNTGAYGISYMDTISRLKYLTIDNKNTDVSSVIFIDEEGMSEC